MTGYAFVYTGNLFHDMFLDCNTFDKGSGVTVARLAQRAGAQFAIIGAIFKVFFNINILCLLFCNIFVGIVYSNHICSYSPLPTISTTNHNIPKIYYNNNIL